MTETTVETRYVIEREGKLYSSYDLWDDDVSNAVYWRRKEDADEQVRLPSFYGSRVRRVTVTTTYQIED